MISKVREEGIFIGLPPPAFGSCGRMPSRGRLFVRVSFILIAVFNVSFEVRIFFREMGIG
jgi:hypothetical protein